MPGISSCPPVALLLAALPLHPACAALLQEICNSLIVCWTAVQCGGSHGEGGEVVCVEVCQTQTCEADLNKIDCVACPGSAGVPKSAAVGSNSAVTGY